MMDMIKRAIKPLGIVFGDIGTSPIYTITAISTIINPEEGNVIGAASLIFWSLVIIVSVQYVFFAMKQSRRGEGGVIVLGEILRSKIEKLGKVKKFIRAYTFFYIFVGTAFIIGDGIITPSISILSAVEGIKLIKEIPQEEVIKISIFIVVILFIIQSRGIDKISVFFSPIMLIWFSSLFVIGVYWVMKYPKIFLALNPIEGVRFVIENKFIGFLVLSEVFLCVTGGEALYADMGQIGARAIKDSWFYIVFPSLFINYLGQSAFLTLTGEKELIFFNSIQKFVPQLYLPAVILSVMATIIASQAMISGTFSIIYQGIMRGFFPRMKVIHTSRALLNQIYIPLQNWLLMFLVIFTIIFFRESKNMAYAYGVSVSFVMFLTGITLLIIYTLEKSRSIPILLIVVIIDIIFWLSTLTKIPHGGFFSIFFATVPIIISTIYFYGQKKLYSSLKTIPFEDFYKMFSEKYLSQPKIDGTAIFMVKDINFIPAYVKRILENGIIFEQNIFVSLVQLDAPLTKEHGETSYIPRSQIAPGLEVLEISYGYMEYIGKEDFRKIFEEQDINPKVIFYGIEDIYSRNPIWKFFSFMKRISYSFEKLHELPPEKLIGVITRVEM